MINVKDQVYAALCTVCDNVSDIYPHDWETLPAIQYVEEANTVYTKTDEEENASYLRYRIDIWDKGSTTQITLAIDEAIAKLGLVRTDCKDVEDPSRHRHKQMRYEGIIDNDTGVVYWEGSR